MLEVIAHLYTVLPWFIRIPVEFSFGYIVLRGIIANDITSWLEDKGFIKKGKGSFIYRALDFLYGKLLGDPQRRRALFEHYKLQELGQGHTAASCLDCSQDKCAVFGTVQTA